jgi:hypothetical protein
VSEPTQQPFPRPVPRPASLTPASDPNDPIQGRLGRRSLLRSAAGISVMGALAGGALPPGGDHNTGSRGNTTKAANPGDLPLTGGPDFPIGIFWPPPPYETTVARYQQIKDAGFTFIISGNYADDGYILARGDLAWAAQVGLKVLISDDVQMNNMSRWFTISDDRSVPLSITTADAKTLVQRALGAYGSYSSLAGFNLYDEPAASNFPSLGRAFSVVRGLAPQLLAYANLLPGTGANYDSYVNGFIQNVQPSLLSFDRYPLGTSSDDAGYFQNWTQIRAAALRAAIPSWTFIQTLAYSGHRQPTAAELAWQVNVSLAYGCKGIQYFTYWTPDPARGEGFGPALVSVDGQLTERYDAAKKLNTTWLAPVGAQLKPVVSESVQHANESPLPAGATGFGPDSWISAASGSAVVLGRFAAASGAGKLLLVTNRSHDATAVTRLTTGSAVTAVSLFDPTTSRYTVRQPGNLDISLAPGTAALYKLN